MNLVLIGYRGTGKSTLGDALGNRLSMPVHHMDDLLVERFHESIPAYVEQFGWNAFRKEEMLLAEELGHLDNVIIDCGGGVVIRQQNMTNLRRNGFVVWLQTDPDTITQRIGGDDNRPSLTGSQSSTDEIIEVLKERTPLYEQASDISIDTVVHSLEECVDKIEAAWRHRLETLETS